MAANGYVAIAIEQRCLGERKETIQQQRSPHGCLDGLMHSLLLGDTMIGERVWVWLNGKLVVDNTVMENFWERDKPIYPTGQIELQNHGSTLWFRNIYLREIPREK